MEPGETPQDSLVRERKEELDADITVGELVDTVRLASAPSAPLLWFLQGGFLRGSAGLGRLWFCGLCAVDPVFFVGYECSAHCFCFPIVATVFDN